MKNWIGLTAMQCQPQDQLSVLEEKELNLLKQQVQLYCYECYAAACAAPLPVTAWPAHVPKQCLTFGRCGYESHFTPIPILPPCCLFLGARLASGLLPLRRPPGHSP